MNKIKIKTVHQEVVEKMTEMIRTGELQKGEKVNELWLCDILGVSRTPIREALRALNNQGLINLIPHKGAFIRQFTPNETKDMFDVMSMLEGMCARIATEKMTDMDFEKLNTLHQNLEDHYEEKNHKEYLETNHEFHSLIQKIAANKSLNEAINTLRQKILLFRHEQLYKPQRFEQSMQEHRTLLDTFKKRDVIKAEKAMRRHLTKQGKALLNIKAAFKLNNQKQEDFHHLT